MEAVWTSLYSEEDFLALPESTEKLEFVDGELVASPSPSPRHQELLRRTLYRLGAWAEGREFVFLGQSPLDVRFAPNRILQPDAFVILGSVALDQDGPIARVPELCIEVLSRNRAYDRLTKRYLYAEAGVAEYWIVEPSGFIERWSGDGLNRCEQVTGVVTTPLLPGLEFDVPALFA